MTESRNRDIATSAVQAVANDIIASDGTLTGGVVTAYTNASDIPASASVGDMAYVTSTNKLFFWRGAWYGIAIGDGV